MRLSAVALSCSAFLATCGKWLMERRRNGDPVDWGLNFTAQPRVLKVNMARCL
jgi:hypothetical protein